MFTKFSVDVYMICFIIINGVATREFVVPVLNMDKMNNYSSLHMPKLCCFCVLSDVSLALVFHINNRLVCMFSNWLFIYTHFSAV